MGIWGSTLSRTASGHVTGTELAVSGGMEGRLPHPPGSWSDAAI